MNVLMSSGQEPQKDAMVCNFGRAIATLQMSTQRSLSLLCGEMFWCLPDEDHLAECKWQLIDGNIGCRYYPEGHYVRGVRVQTDGNQNDHFPQSHQYCCPLPEGYQIGECNRLLLDTIAKDSSETLTRGRVIRSLTAQYAQVCEFSVIHDINSTVLACDENTDDKARENDKIRQEQQDKAHEKLDGFNREADRVDGDTAGKDFRIEGDPEAVESLVNTAILLPVGTGLGIGVGVGVPVHIVLEKIKECGTLAVANGASTTGPVASGQTVTITCNSGYEIATAADTCEDGAYTNYPTGATCAPKSCAPGPVTNGVTATSSITVSGGRARINCTGTFTYSTWATCNLGVFDDKCSAVGQATCTNREYVPFPDGFLCDDDQNCLGSHLVCNGNYECADRSDELDCPCPRDGRSFQCDISLCIYPDWVCDGFYNCYDTTDELGCPCPRRDRSFRCASGLCIKKEYECDGSDIDCNRGRNRDTFGVDKSDEEHCVCPEDRPFKCRLGLCISQSSVCDGNDYDCDSNKVDNSDEENCPVM